MMRLSPNLSARMPLYAFLFAALVQIALLAPLIRTDGIWVNDEGNRLLQIRAFAEGKNGLRDPLCGASLPGLLPYVSDAYFVRDPKSGEIVSGYTEAFPRLAAPLYRAGGFPLVRSAVLLCSFLCMLLILPLARLCKLSGPAAAGAVLLTGLGTPLFFYAGTVLEITMAAMLFCVFLFAAGQAVRRRHHWKAWLCAGFLLSLIPWFREEAYMIFAGFLAALLLLRPPWKAPAAFGGAFLLGAAPLWILNFTRWGSIFGLHYLIYREIAPEPVTLLSRLHSLYFFLFGSNADGLPGLAAGVICVFSLFFGLQKDDHPLRRQVKAIIALLLAAVSLLNLAALVFESDPIQATLSHQSMCGTVPFFLLPFLLTRTFLAERNIFWKFLFCAGAFSAAGIAVCLEYGSRGVFFGPRYHTLMLPLYALLAVRSFHYMKGTPETASRRMIISGALTVCLCAAACQFSGVRLLRIRKAWSGELNAVCSTLVPPVIVSDVFYVPEELAPQPDSVRTLYLMEHGLPSLETLTSLNGIETFYYLKRMDPYASGPDLLFALAEHWDIRPVRTFSAPELAFLSLQLFRLDRKKTP